MMGYTECEQSCRNKREKRRERWKEVKSHDTLLLGVLKGQTNMIM
jgi:hypothetical protein